MLGWQVRDHITRYLERVAAAHRRLGPLDHKLLMSLPRAPTVSMRTECEETSILKLRQ